MVGCPHGAKNTLVKNYLWFAERRGAQVLPERQVVDVRPLGAADGWDGYEVITERPAAGCASDRRTAHRPRRRDRRRRARDQPAAARCKLHGSLPRLSDRLGDLVRTNSEAILAVTAAAPTTPDFTRRDRDHGSIYPDPDTHIETVIYGEAADSMRWLFTLLRRRRHARHAAAEAARPIARHPLHVPARCSTRAAGRGARSSCCVMQTLDNAIALRARRGRRRACGCRPSRIRSSPNPTYIPAANESASGSPSATGGVAQSSIIEALANIPTTAHILGGAVIGADRVSGVVDAASASSATRTCSSATAPRCPPTWA